MKKLTMLVAVLLAATASVAVAQVPVGTPVSIGWDYTDQQLADGQVVVFSVCVNAEPCQRVEPAAAKSLLVPDLYTFSLGAALSIGAYTVTVQACNADMCSGAASTAFTVDPIKTIVTPAKPGNVRVIRGGA